MLLVNACIMGGVLYSGLKTYFKRHPRKKATWLVSVRPPAPRQAQPTRMDGQIPLRGNRTYRSFMLSSISVGLSMSGALLYPPLTLASVPLTVYAALLMFEKSHESLWGQRRINASVLCSTTIIGTLATQHYLLAALTNWLYYYFALLAQRIRYINQLLLIELEHSYHQFLSQVYGVKPPSVWVMVQGMGIETPFADVKIGDVVIVNEGEVIPVDGTIVDGSAVVTSLMRMSVSPPREKRVGEYVTASSVVLSGRINVRVERL